MQIADYDSDLLNFIDSLKEIGEASLFPGYEIFVPAKNVENRRENLMMKGNTGFQYDQPAKINHTIEKYQTSFLSNEKRKISETDFHPIVQESFLINQDSKPIVTIDLRHLGQSQNPSNSSKKIFDSSRGFERFVFADGSEDLNRSEHPKVPRYRTSSETNPLTLSSLMSLNRANDPHVSR